MKAGTPGQSLNFHVHCIIYSGTANKFIVHKFRFRGYKVVYSYKRILYSPLRNRYETIHFDEHFSIDQVEQDNHTLLLITVMVTCYTYILIMSDQHFKIMRKQHSGSHPLF